MTIELAYLLAMGIIIFFAIAAVIFLKWNARAESKKKDEDIESWLHH
jgi:hypothetical protein